MAKNKRKISSTQRDKLAIETAKILKKKGVLSKQTKLHGGKFISRAVLKKVQEFQHVARPDYRALKVTKDYAKKAKEEGYQVVQGNRVIVPADHDFVKRVKKGIISGLKPVKGGFMSEITIPFTAENVHELTNKLQYESLDDLKLDHEQFAFSFHGNMSYRAFLDTDTMRKYLEHYKQDEKIRAVKVYRLHPSDVSTFIKGREYRERMKRQTRTRTVQDRRAPTGKRTYSERMERLEKVAPNRAAKVREKAAKKSVEQRAKLLSDPAKLEAYRAKGRERARVSYQNRSKK